MINFKIFLIELFLFLFLINFSLADKSIKEKGFDVLSYKLSLKINMKKGELTGKNEIKLVAVKPVDKILLNSFGLIIENIFTKGKSLEYKIISNQEQLEIQLDRKYVENDTIKINIDYSYDKQFSRKEDRKGFYYYKKDNEQILENIAYTMSEPSDARCWFPCWDELNDKVLSEIEISVDSGYTAVSNGLLEKIKSNKNGTTTFFWKSQNPITTYLMSFAVSKYSHFSHVYNRLTNPNEKIEVSYYIWKEDSNGSFFNAERAFKKTVKMMEVFSNVFGEYPFEKYGMVAVTPFNFGGEEHQTLTTIHRYWLYGEDHGIAHELAHQWWGDLVTCGDWKDIWLNESFATYAEAIWVEQTGNKEEFIKKIRSFYRLGKEWEASIYDPAGQGKKLFSEIVYQKGALIVHTLRNIIGDSVFFRILEVYKNKFRNSYSRTEDFISIVNSVTGKDMRWFFDEYVFGKGWPKLSYSWKYDSNKMNIELLVKQIQSGSWPTYRFPVDVVITGNQTKIININIDGKSRQQKILIPYKEEPKDLKLDPDNKIFLEVIR